LKRTYCIDMIVAGVGYIRIINKDLKRNPSKKKWIRDLHEIADHIKEGYAEDSK